MKLNEIMKSITGYRVYYGMLQWIGGCRNARRMWGWRGRCGAKIFYKQIKKSSLDEGYQKIKIKKIENVGAIRNGRGVLKKFSLKTKSFLFKSGFNIDLGTAYGTVMHQKGTK